MVKSRIKIPDGRVKGIDGVLYIPSLAQNLLSMNKLGDVGVQVVFLSGGCKMIRGSMVLAKGVRLVPCIGWMMHNSVR